MIQKSNIKNLMGTLESIAVLFMLCALTGTGCVSVANLEYREYVHKLNDKSELAISTFPAWYPTEEVNTPPVYIGLQTDEFVALRFQVRQRGGSASSKPHINSNSVLVHKFAYRLDEGPEKVVLVDFSGSSWMQVIGSHAERTKNGIPYQEGSVLHVMADLTMNGKDYSVKGEMPARRRVVRVPIFLHSRSP